MKRVLITFAILIGILAVASILTDAAMKKSAQKSELTPPSKKTINVGAPEKPKGGKNHSKENLDCKLCHDCDYPTADFPCLKSCPRPDVSFFHSANEGPEVVVMDKLSKRYGSVVFSHKLHAQMSAMGDGCTGCHHYNTKGPVLNCNKCHEESRVREDFSKPDLVASYHRQCMDCHRQWNKSTDCNYCHLPLGKEGEAMKSTVAQKLVGRSHPETPKPDKVLYETTSDKGKFVTFYHDEHIEKFKIGCIKCHADENCTTCHTGSEVKRQPDHYTLNLKPHKTFDEHHKPCSTCHDAKQCSKCHSDKETPRFDHNRTAFPLTGTHAGLTCNKCHKTQPIGKVNRECSACHTDFTAGKFDHSRAGLKLDDLHADADCKQCHAGGRFDRPPVCADCHDDKSYPKDSPGVKVVRKKK